VVARFKVSCGNLPRKSNNRWSDLQAVKLTGPPPALKLRQVNITCLVQFAGKLPWPFIRRRAQRQRVVNHFWRPALHQFDGLHLGNKDGVSRWKTVSPRFPPLFIFSPELIAHPPPAWIQCWSIERFAYVYHHPVLSDWFSYSYQQPGLSLGTLSRQSIGWNSSQSRSRPPPSQIRQPPVDSIGWTGSLSWPPPLNWFEHSATFLQAETVGYNFTLFVLFLLCSLTIHFLFILYITQSEWRIPGNSHSQLIKSDEKYIEPMTLTWQPREWG
jgi:hypothetical protein